MQLEIGIFSTLSVGQLIVSFCMMLLLFLKLVMVQWIMVAMAQIKTRGELTLVFSIAQ